MAKEKSSRMAENNIPYKVRAALLLVPLNTPMPTGAVTHSLWYIAVRSGDVHRVQHYLAQKGIPKMEQLSARLLLTAGILLLIAGGFSPFSKDGSIPTFSGQARLDACWRL